MARLTWTVQALDDIESICEFIAKDAPRYAQVFATHVFGAAEKIRTFPMSGRMVPEVGQENIREIILGNYRIIYRVGDQEIQVLTVYHSARLLGPDVFAAESHTQ